MFRNESVIKALENEINFKTKEANELNGSMRKYIEGEIQGLYLAIKIAQREEK